MLGEVNTNASRKFKEDAAHERLNTIAQNVLNKFYPVISFCYKTFATYVYNALPSEETLTQPDNIDCPWWAHFANWQHPLPDCFPALQQISDLNPGLDIFAALKVNHVPGDHLLKQLLQEYGCNYCQYCNSSNACRSNCCNVCHYCNVAITATIAIIIGITVRVTCASITNTTLSPLSLSLPVSFP